MKRGTARPRGRYRAGAGDKGVGKICKERARTPGGVDFSARDFDFGGTRGGGVEQHLFERYPRFMRVTTVEGVEVNVDEVEVLRCAGQIFERRRRTRSGPIRRHPCRWCAALISGRKAWAEHEQRCPQRRDCGPLEPGDLVGVDLAAYSVGDGS